MSEKFERLGNYILLEKVNSGGMAEVYLSKSIGANGVNKFLAIKRILPQFADKPEFIEMFNEEAKIAVNLNHNNVVTIIDFKAAENQLYLVMEYVQGQNLRQVLQQKKKKGLALSLDFIVYVIREVVAGLDHAHRLVDRTTGKHLGIIHRDMSPQNIMVSYDGEIKIVDFGIAKTEVAGEQTRVGTLKGKFSYMSPEQAEGIVIDQTSDIFSVGIILWELIADDRLFIANNEQNILKRIKECDIPDLRRVNPTVPSELERIVKKTLMKDKSQRYQSAADLQKDLTRFLNKEYPEFTPSDFSTFMKFLYETEYATAQERIVNYAKLDFTSINETSNEATLFIKSPTSVGLPHPPEFEPPANFNFNPGEPFPPPPVPRPSPFSGTKPSNPPPPPKGETGISMIQNAATQIDRSRVVPSGTMTGIRKNGTAQKPLPTLKPTASRRPSSMTNSTLATRSGVTSSGIRYKAPPKPPTSDFAKFLMTLTILGLVFGGVFLTLPRKKKAQITQVFEAYVNLAGEKPIKKGSKNNNKGGQEEVSSKATLKMLIKSNPGRARIFINSKDQGTTTPATVEVEANKPFTLTLLADGYLQHSSKITAIKDGQEHFAEMTPVKFGYISINVINAGVETNIYIDGQKLEDRPPIEKWAIQANKPIKIRAVHPFTNAIAEETVMVGVDEKKTYNLILKNGVNDSSENTNR